MSNYLQGVRYRFNKLKLPIVVTDVQPGFVDTRMAAGNLILGCLSAERRPGRSSRRSAGGSATCIRYEALATRRVAVLKVRPRRACIGETLNRRSARRLVALVERRSLVAI